MTIENGSLKDWDDRHYQSIDDLPPEAWDAVRDKLINHEADRDLIASIIYHGYKAGYSDNIIAERILSEGFKRD